MAQLPSAVQAAAAQLGLKQVSLLTPSPLGLAILVTRTRVETEHPAVHQQITSAEVLEICAELAEGTVLPAGWSKGYDTQHNRLYFVDEVSDAHKQKCISLRKLRPESA